MKAASLNELKTELKLLSSKELVEVASRLARYKKENKELLTYLLFEADDEAGYIKNVMDDTVEKFADLNTHSNLYATTKSIRKILRGINKFIRFAGSKNVEVRLLMHFCSTLKNSGIPYHRSTALVNLYDRQLVKISKAISALHEDAQYDCKMELEQLL
jgi:hypothetical protein